MHDKCMQRWSSSFVIPEMQVKTTVTYHCGPICKPAVAVLAIISPGEDSDHLRSKSHHLTKSSQTPFKESLSEFLLCPIASSQPLDSQLPGVTEPFPVSNLGLSGLETIFLVLRH